MYISEINKLNIDLKVWSLVIELESKMSKNIIND